MNVLIKRVEGRFSDLPLPKYETSGSAGMDVLAAIDESITINPGAIELVPTSLAIALPEGFECQVRSRSGLALKHGIFALNSPGTIDSDYRGEIKIILANFSKEPFLVERGSRIAQLVVAKYETIFWKITADLPTTNRSDGGFGSTGL